MTAPNAIIELPVVTEGPAPGLPPDRERHFEPETLGTVAEILSEQGADYLSARVEIERRTIVEYDGDEPATIRFTAATLTDIATMLTIALAEALETENRELSDEIAIFGQLIDAHTVDPLNQETTIEIPGLEPMGDADDIDPFDAIARKQDVRFTDLQQS